MLKAIMLRQVHIRTNQEPTPKDTPFNYPHMKYCMLASSPFKGDLFPKMHIICISKTSKFRRNRIGNIEKQIKST